MKRVALVLAGLSVASCSFAPNQDTPLQVGGYAEYARDVHPLLEASCATLDCHGTVNRPLRLYSEIGLRMRDDLRDQPITDEELRQNVVSLIGVDPAPRSVDDDFVLVKPLAVAAGGVHHVGGDLWPTRDDPAYWCVRGWLLGESDDPANQQSCMDAYDSVRLLPP